MMQAINAAGNDPAKSAFFEKINEAIIMQEQLQQLLDQGTQFYMKLNDILVRLLKTNTEGRELQNPSAWCHSAVWNARHILH